jgi:methylglutamate dehydrogenase subunit B
MAEFRFQGEVTQRPRERPSLEALSGYVYLRRNVAGVQREWWYHRHGCETWFIAERDTRTNEVLSVEIPAPAAKPGAQPQEPPDLAELG